MREGRCPQRPCSLRHPRKIVCNTSFAIRLYEVAGKTTPADSGNQTQMNQDCPRPIARTTTNRSHSPGRADFGKTQIKLHAGLPPRRAEPHFILTADSPSGAVKPCTHTADSFNRAAESPSRTADRSGRTAQSFHRTAGSPSHAADRFNRTAGSISLTAGSFNRMAESSNRTAKSSSRAGKSASRAVFHQKHAKTAKNRTFSMFYPIRSKKRRLCLI